MYSIIDTFIRYILYFVFIMIFAHLFLTPSKNFFRRRRLDLEYFNESKIIKHIEMLLAVVFNNKSYKVVITYFIVTLSLFLFPVLLLFKQEPLWRVLLIALLFASLPYILLRVKLYSIRIASSYEGEELITEITNHYKLHYKNMIEALDQSYYSITKRALTRKALERLSVSLKQYRSNEELDYILQEFVFSIQTEWALLLANSIYQSIVCGDDVSASLDDILEDLKDLKKIQEKDKQDNHESFTMIKYVTPASYLLSVYLMFSQFNFTLQKYIDHQFRHPLGIKFFIFSMGSIALNYIIYILMRKPKNDF